MRGDFSSVKALLRNRADPNLFSCNAVKDGQLNKVQFLLSRGADVNKPLADGLPLYNLRNYRWPWLDRTFVPQANKLITDQREYTIMKRSCRFYAEEIL